MDKFSGSGYDQRSERKMIKNRIHIRFIEKKIIIFYFICYVSAIKREL